MLQNFILIKKTIIIQIYLIINIIKLKFNGINISAFYLKIYKYEMIFF